MRATRRRSVRRASCQYHRRGILRFSRAWTPVWILPNAPDSRREMPTSFAMPEGARATTRSAPWSSPTSCLARMSSSSFTTPTAACCSSRTRLMRNLLASSLETAELTPSGFRDVGKGPGSTEGEFIDWLTMKDNAAAVLADVRRIRNHPLIPKSIPVHGYIYDVRTGRLEEVSGAAAAGKAM